MKITNYLYPAAYGIASTVFAAFAGRNIYKIYENGLNSPYIELTQLTLNIIALGYGSLKFIGKAREFRPLPQPRYIPRLLRPITQNAPTHVTLGIARQNHKKQQ